MAARASKMAAGRRGAAAPRVQGGRVLRRRPVLFSSEADPIVAALEARAYNAAQLGRLNSDWRVSHLSGNEEIRHGLQIVRAASRNLERNSDLYRRFLWLVESNVVHRGFELQSTPRNARGGIDRSAAVQIERAWRAWARRPVTLDGRLTLPEVQRLAIRTIARDGEIVVVLAVRRGQLALQVLEADHLPITLHVPRDRTVLGIELDEDVRPLAYWITDRHPGDQMGTGTTRGTMTRYPADAIVHAFRIERPGQVRGVPWGTAAFDSLLMLLGYKVAELAAARLNASRPVSVESELAADQPFRGDEEREGEDAQIMVDGGPGGITIPPPGHKLVWAPAEHPAGNYGGFTTEIKRDIAAGLGVSYHALNSDLSGANFSSLRHGRADEIRFYQGAQDFFGRGFMSPIFEAWLRTWLLQPGVPLPVERAEKFAEHAWEAPTFEPLDPQKEAEGAQSELDLGVTTWSELARKRGKNLRQLLEERRDDLALMDELGISLPGAKRSPKQSGDTPPPPTDEDEGVDEDAEEMDA